MSFRFLPTALPEVLIIEPEVHHDPRGHFLETWHQQKWAAAGLDVHFVQDNQSRSRSNVLRGLHYQRRHPQGKLVRVISGEIFDVAVDARRSSPHFGQWVGVTLSATNHRSVWIPPGFAHGFYVTQGPADFLYRCTDFYVPGDEQCIRWDDPDLAIAWPLPPGVQPIVGAKDAEGAAWRDADTFL